MEHPYHKEEHQIMQEEKIVNDDKVEQEPQVKNQQELDNYQKGPFQMNMSILMMKRKLKAL